MGGRVTGIRARSASDAKPNSAPVRSLPSLLVIRSVIGNTKTLVFTASTVVMATIVGTG